MPIPENIFQSEKILNILENFTNQLNEIRLDNLSPELYDLVEIIDMSKNIILENQFISEEKLIQIKQTINDQINTLLIQINNNPQIVMVIENAYTKPFEMLYVNNNNTNNLEELYKIKYIKY